MGLGPAFINVLDDDPTQASEDPIVFRTASTLGARLRTLIEGLPRTRRWTLYLSRSGVIDRDVEVPSNFVLTCAPRVVLFLIRGVTLTIRGPVELGRERRFSLAETSRVMLLGTLDAILPVWWRVGPGDDDAPAIEAAVETVLRRADERLPQAPIVLDRPYWLRRPVQIAWEGQVAGVDDLREIIFSGRHPLGASDGPASLNGSGTGSLLSVRGHVRLVMAAVGLSATDVPTVEPPTPESLIDMAGEFDGSSFERCTFCGLRQSFIRLRRLPRSRIADLTTIADRLDGRQSGDDADLEQLATEVDAPEAGIVRITSCAMRRTARFVAEDGIAVLRGARVLLSITSSSFRSNAGSVVAVSIGHLTIEDCRFDLDLSSDHYLDQENQLKKSPVRGEGVFISRLWSAIVAGEVVRRELLGARRLSPPPVPLGGVSVVATHLRVRGLAALAGAPISQAGTEMQLTLNNVLQEGTPLAEFSVDLQGAPVDGALVLHGCVFAGDVLAFEANHGSFQVIDVGTRLPPRARILTSNVVRWLPRTAVQP